MEEKTNAQTPTLKNGTEAAKAAEDTAGKAQKATEEENLFADLDAKKNGKNNNKKENEPENAFEKQMKRRRRARRIKTVITIIVLALLAAGGYQLYMYLQKMNATEEDSVSTTTYRAQLVTEGSITSTVSYTGTMTPATTESEYAEYDESVVTSIGVGLSQTFKKGSVLMTLELDEDNELVEKMEELDEKIASTDRLSDTRYLRSDAKGYIKDIKFYVGCDITAIMDQYGYIALVCLDNRMQVDVKTNALSQYEKVTLAIEGKEYAGVVQNASGGTANIIIESSKPAVGAVAEVFKTDGTSVGTGMMELVSYSQITAVDGYITSVNVKDGQLVRRNDKICLCRDLPTNPDYQDLIDEKEELQQDIDDACEIVAPFDGRVLEINVKEGDTVNTENTLLVLQSMEGYIVSLAVDELDIASIKLGQKATVELDALEGTFEGEVSYISYVNASSGNTVRYTVEVALEDIEGVLPEMSATCTIITADSGVGLIIPADALQLVDRKSVVYLAPDDARFGTSYKDTELDLTTLKTVEVEVVQSDGSNLLVSGDLTKDQLILVKSKTTSSVYSSDSSSSNNGFSFGGDFGGMPGGGMPSGGMPSGGMPGGNSSSGRSSSSSGGSSGRSSSGSSRGN